MTDQIKPSKLFTYEIEKNETYGDFRVVEYKDGEWNNEWDNNWSKETAAIVRDRIVGKFNNFSE